MRRFWCIGARAKADIKTSPAQTLHKSRTLVLTLAALFSIDALPAVCSISATIIARRLDICA
ncbi:hypothetical protein AJ87_23360 [Rhizobium yanglingense]|nr:hypothetical protein AJ87_23360 [Rhizobium yanglingense]